MIAARRGTRLDDVAVEAQSSEAGPIAGASAARAVINRPSASHKTSPGPPPVRIRSIGHPATKSQTKRAPA